MLSSHRIPISGHSNVILRKATIDDLEFVNKISFKIMDSVVAIAWNGRFRWESWFHDMEEAILDDIHMFFIIQAEEEDVGYLWMNEEHSLLWITAIVLEEEWQRKGIGNQIIQKLIKSCKDTGKEAIELGVQQNNKAAINFYKEMGFEKYDSIRYAHTNLMRLQLSKRKRLDYS